MHEKQVTIVKQIAVIQWWNAALEVVPMMDEYERQIQESTTWGTVGKSLPVDLLSPLFRRIIIFVDRDPDNLSKQIDEEGVTAI